MIWFQWLLLAAYLSVGAYLAAYSWLRAKDEGVRLRRPWFVFALLSIVVAWPVAITVGALTEGGK